MRLLSDMLGAARNAPGAVNRAVEDLARDPDESRRAPGPAEVAENLRSVDARLGPIHDEISALDGSAAQLRAELEKSRDEIASLNDTAKSLNDSMARLSGEIEHLLERVPGLSPERARERAEEIGNE